jgi:hypothetical protein
VLTFTTFREDVLLLALRPRGLEHHLFVLSHSGSCGMLVAPELPRGQSCLDSAHFLEQK